MDTPKKEERKPGGKYVVLTVSMPAELRDALKREWHRREWPGSFSDFLRARLEPAGRVDKLNSATDQR